MRIRYLLCVLLPFSTSAFAADPYSAAPAASGAPDEYVTPASLPPTLLPPPLAVHSAEWNAEVQQIIDLQKTVTDDDKAQITAEAHFSPAIFAASVPNWDEKHYPATFHLLDKASRTCGDVTEQDKTFWNMRRPYIEEPRIKSLAGNIANGSYPSGHASCTRVMAETLGQVDPAKVADFRARAALVAHHRVMAGVHYPSDIRGGEQLALIIVGAMEQSPDFQKDVKAAQQEFGTASGH